MGWPVLPPAAALRPDRLAYEAGRQAIHGLAAGCGRPVRSPSGLILWPAGPSRCSLRQNRPAQGDSFSYNPHDRTSQRSMKLEC